MDISCLFLVLFPFIYASNVFNENSSETFDVFENEASENAVLTIQESTTIPNNFNLLAHEVIQYVFEFAFDDYLSLRLVSKNFREVFDEFVCTISWKSLPNFSKMTFSHWNENFKYQMAPLARVLHFTIKPLNADLGGLNLTSDFHLRNYAMKSIILLGFTNLDASFKLLDAFLKLEIMKWNDVYKKFFEDKFVSVARAWSLGLVSIAREMSINNVDVFFGSIGKDHEGLRLACRSKHLKLCRLMVSTMRSQSHQFKFYDISYLNDIIEVLIFLKYWDVLYDVYEMNQELVRPSHLHNIAARGCIEGLRALRKFAFSQAGIMASKATSNGHLEFLKEMDAFGLLGRDCHLVVHEAASTEHIECLEFLVSRLGAECLRLSDQR